MILVNRALNRPLAEGDLSGFDFSLSSIIKIMIIIISYCIVLISYRYEYYVNDLNHIVYLCIGVIINWILFSLFVIYDTW